MANELSEFLNAVNMSKEDLMAPDRSDRDRWVKAYVPYIVNHCLMPHPDAIFWANELNMRQFMDKDMQFRFLLNSLPKKKRFAKWLKKDSDETNLDLVKEYFNYSTRKAKEILPLITDEDIMMMQTALSKGGRK